MKRIAVIGGGVAGLTATVYARRANVEVTLFEQYGLGGQTATIDKIDNFPSYVSVEGWQLASNVAVQAQALGFTLVSSKVLSLDKVDNEFVITTTSGEYKFCSVIVATGTMHNKLGVEQDYVGKGVSYCTTCDGNFFKNLPVVVVGGGNQSVKEAMYLSGVCSSVTVICPSDKLHGDEMNVDDLLKLSNVNVKYNSTVTSVFGEGKVEGITVYDGTTYNLPCNAVFVAVGLTPNVQFVKCNVALHNGYIVVDERCATSVEGLFACGDVTDGTLKQIVTACADGAKAGTFASAYVRKNQ